MRCSNGSVHQATAHRSGQRGTCSCSRLRGCRRAGEVSKQTPFFPHLSHSSSTEGTGCQASPRSSLSQALPRDMGKAAGSQLLEGTQGMNELHFSGLPSPIQRLGNGVSSFSVAATESGENEFHSHYLTSE